MLASLVDGKGFAVDASLIAADANKCRSTPGNEWSHDIDPDAVGRAVQDYLSALDDPAWGAAMDVTPKFVAPADPATDFVLKEAANVTSSPTEKQIASVVAVPATDPQTTAPIMGKATPRSF